MSATIVLPFRAADYLAAHAEIHTGPDFVNRKLVAEGYESGGPAYTALLAGRILACAGVSIHWQGYGTAWAIVTPLGASCAFRVHRAVATGLRRIIGDHALRRVQADVLVGCEPAVRWVEALGFSKESLMPAFGPCGESAWRYVLLPR